MYKIKKPITCPTFFLIENRTWLLIFTITRPTFCRTKFQKVSFFIMSASKPKPIPNLPKTIRDELRVTCALQGLTHMNEGNGMTVLKQYDAMFDYYHGKELSEVSQIKCLCEGIGCFSDLY